MSKLISYNPSGTIILPVGLERLAWLQGDGTAYIDTGTNLNYSSVNNIHVICTNDFADKQAAPFIGTSSYQTGFMALYHYTNNAICDRYITGSSYTSYTIPVGNKINFQLQLDYKNLKCSYWLNGSKDLNRTITKGSDTGNIRFFKGSTNNYAATKCKCYEVSISIDGGDLKHFIPVRVKSATTIDGTNYSAGTLGMYDYNNDKLYTNAASSGSFIAGPSCDVEGFPTSEYCLVEYLLSDGNSYFNTGLTVKSNTITKLTMQSVSATASLYNMICGYAASSSWQPYGLGTSTTVTNFAPYGGTLSQSTVPTTMTTVTFTSTNSEEVSGSNILLFGIGGSPGNYPRLRFKLERALILEGTTVKLDWIPCYRRSDMTPGMYDIIGRLFKANAGSGTFTLGPSITFGWGGGLEWSRRCC